MDSLPTRVEELVFTNENHRLSLEPFEDIHFVHQQVYNWNRQTLNMTRNLLSYLERKGYKLRVFVSPENTKLIRYATLMGFEYSHTQTAPLDGVDYHIYRRT